MHPMQMHLADIEDISHLPGMEMHNCCKHAEDRTQHAPSKTQDGCKCGPDCKVCTATSLAPASTPEFQHPVATPEAIAWLTDSTPAFQAPSRLWRPPRQL